MSENDKNENGEKRPFDMLSAIMRWEGGYMDTEEEIEFAQHLWDTGLWKQLQGCYGRFVHAMIEAGHINTDKKS